MRFIGNRYEVLNCEDNIEYNKIYKAKDVYYNKIVLIKVIEHNDRISEDFVSNLIDETTVIDEINSPYILKTLDVGIHCTEYTTLYYIVNEYTEGIGLNDLVVGNYIHLDAIINIATQILKALEGVHTHGIYHGDLRPNNIIVDQWHNIKICDFGITRANYGANIRNTGDIRYLCPHQLCINYTDTESDFFSLGIILFEAIFKKLPFGQADTEKDMLKLIDKGVIWNDIKAINGNNELIYVIRKLLSRKEKYTNTQDAIIDLSKIMYDKADIEEDEANDDIIEDIKYEENKKTGAKSIALVATIVALASLMVLSCI